LRSEGGEFRKGRGVRTKGSEKKESKDFLFHIGCGRTRKKSTKEKKGGERGRPGEGDARSHGTRGAKFQRGG